MRNPIKLKGNTKWTINRDNFPWSEIVENRRSFLKKSTLSVMTFSVPFATRFAGRARGQLIPGTPRSALVVWYSQTGNTERAGRLIAETLKKSISKVDALEYREADKATLGNYDLIVAGSPVYYYDVPENFKTWLGSIPQITGKPIASYVTFGGEGGNQHNTACTLLELLADRGGVPVAMNAFGNMSTYAITWSFGNVARVLKYKNLPDKTTYDHIRDYAVSITRNVREGRSIEIHKDFDFRELIKNSPSIWATKLFIYKHTIDKEKCVECGTCVRKCPVGAIDISTAQVDEDCCIACLGCVNNCPEQAFNMVFMGKKVYGYKEFIRRNNINVKWPVELQKG
jgi:ferredoxin/flavodoxin